MNGKNITDVKDKQIESWASDAAVLTWFETINQPGIGVAQLVGHVLQVVSIQAVVIPEHLRKDISSIMQKAKVCRCTL